jgi:hypothetical protein
MTTGCSTLSRVPAAGGRHSGELQGEIPKVVKMPEGTAGLGPAA